MKYTFKDLNKRDIYKSLIYMLCDFLIKQRDNPRYGNFNLTLPIKIELKKIDELFEYIDAPSNEEKIEKIKIALEQLNNEDSIVQGFMPTVISIKNPEVLNNFLEEYSSNKVIIIKCSIAGLNAYQARLRGEKQNKLEPILNQNVIIGDEIKNGKNSNVEISKIVKKRYKGVKLEHKNGYGFRRGNTESANRRGIKKADESQNRHGVCDLQIMTKIIALSRKLKKTPSLGEIKDEYGGGIISIMHYRYGSYIKYCRNYLKLTPLYSGRNPRPIADVKKEIIDCGNKIIKKYGRFSIAKMPDNQARYMYKHFKNVKHFKKSLIKEKK